MTIWPLQPQVYLPRGNSYHLQTQWFPCQDIRVGQSQKTLAYAQILQYWAEKSNLLILGQPHLLAGCMLELRRVMEPYVAFSDDVVLEGATPQERSLEGQIWATIPMEIQPDPTEELAPAKVPMEEAASIEGPPEETPPTKEPTEEPTALKVTIGKPAGEPDIPPVQHGDKGKG